MDIFYKPLGDHHVPTQSNKGDAGYDLYAAEDVAILPYLPTLVPTNLSIAIPDGHVLFICSRSSVALKRRVIVSNGIGVLDSGFRGKACIILTYLPRPILYRSVGDNSISPDEPIARDPIIIKKGERIAQAVLLPYVEQNWVKAETLPETERGTGGFGSSGT